jgi:hypothetical protein
MSTFNICYFNVCLHFIISIFWKLMMVLVCINSTCHWGSLSRNVIVWVLPRCLMVVKQSYRIVETSWILVNVQAAVRTCQPIDLLCMILKEPGQKVIEMWHLHFLTHLWRQRYDTMNSDHCETENLKCHKACYLSLSLFVNAFLAGNIS